MQYLVLAGVFLGTLLVIVGLYTFVNRRQLSASDAVRRRLLDDLRPADPARAPAAIIRRDREASSIGFLNRILAGKGFTVAAQAELDRAGSRQTVGTFGLTMVLAAGVGALVGIRIAGATLGAALAGIGVFVPILLLKKQQADRAKKFEQQLPEAIDMLVNAMKAGYSLQAAMKFIGDELGEPIGPEFVRFYDEQRLGMDVRAALLNLQERVDTLDVKMFVTALLIQRESGGNLAEIMTNLSSLMRERMGLRGQIDVLTAEPKMSAVVLTALPVILFVVINVMNPRYMTPLYTTNAGHLLLAYSAVSLTVGYVFLNRIGQIDI